MTARAWLNRRKRRVFGGILLCVGLFVATFLARQLGGGPMPLVLPAFVLLFAIVIVAQRALFRCPRCRGNLAPLVMNRGGLSIDKKLAYCPYCGVSLDEELGGDDGGAERDRDDRW